MFAKLFHKKGSLEIQGTSHAFSFTAGGGGYVFRPHCSLGMCNFLFVLLLLCLYTFQHGGEGFARLLFYSVMIRCRRELKAVYLHFSSSITLFENHRKSLNQLCERSELQEKKE